MKLIALLSLLTLCACNEKKESKDSIFTPRSVLLGEFEACVNDTSDSTSTKMNLNFADTTFVENSKSYDALNCPSNKLETVLITHFNYQLLSNNVIETTLQAANLTFFAVGSTTTHITAANSASLCGFSNWADSVPKDVINLNCAGTAFTYGDVDTSPWTMSATTLTLFGMSLTRK
jgi:hypothetical protein